MRNMGTGFVVLLHHSLFGFVLKSRLCIGIIFIIKVLLLVIALIACHCHVLLQNGDARIFNEFLPELKTTLLSKGRANFWQEIVDGNICLMTLTFSALITFFSIKIGAETYFVFFMWQQCIPASKMYG